MVACRHLRIVLIVFAAVAMASCTRWSTEADRDPGAYARRLLADGDTARAIARLETTDLDTDGNPHLYITLAHLYRADGTITGRLRAQRVLERALQVHPDDPRVLFELGRTYYEQTFYPDAVRCFREVLDRDPGLCDARHYLGLYHYEKWKRFNDYTDALDTARVYFAQVLECAPDNEDAARRLAYGLYALGRPDSALEISEYMIEHFADRAEGYFLRGALAYDDDRIADAGADFERALARLDSTTRAAYDDITPFLSHEERQRYAAAAVERRAVYDRAYWLDLDPDATTEINQRRIEHIYRTFLADLFYSCARPPRRGWETERGAALVKFGWPEVMESTLGGGSRTGREETWVYWIDGEMLEFEFVDEFLNGNLRIPYRADDMLSVLLYSPGATDTGPGFVPVPGAMEVVALKDSDMGSTLVVALAVDADSVAAAAELDHVNHFVVRGTLFDATWTRDGAFADTLWTSQTPKRTRAGGRTYEFVRTIPIPFGAYQVACAFGDEHGHAAAVFRGSADADRFAADRLAMSDLLLQHGDTDGPVLTRGTHRLRPDPARRYRDGESMPVYFEVYNLGVTAGASDYTVTFAIYDAAPPPESGWERWGERVARLVGRDEPPTISQTFTRTGGAHRAAEDIVINLDSLEPGRYQLVVTVDDAIRGRSAESRRVFYKLEREAGWLSTAED